MHRVEMPARQSEQRFFNQSHVTKKLLHFLDFRNSLKITFDEIFQNKRCASDPALRRSKMLNIELNGGGLLIYRRTPVKEQAETKLGFKGLYKVEKRWFSDHSRMCLWWKRK